MFSTYTLDTEELTPQFIEVLQRAYPKKRIEIFVQEAMDETDYLLETPQQMPVSRTPLIPPRAECLTKSATGICL